MELGEAAARCDALIVMAVLTEQTHHIVNAAILDCMKPTAVVINMARGPISNEQDLIAALMSGSIAGAGLDVFEKEPVTNELLGMDNVTLSPHCLSWTDENVPRQRQQLCKGHRERPELDPAGIEVPANLSVL